MPDPIANPDEEIKNLLNILNHWLNNPIDFLLFAVLVLAIALICGLIGGLISMLLFPLLKEEKEE